MTDIMNLLTKSPSDLVRAFIADYAQWNDESERHFAGNDFEAAMNAAEAAYAKLVARYCTPGHQYSPISSGTESLHDPTHEHIISVELNGEYCLVKTKHAKVNGGVSFTADYEYHLQKLGPRWYLTSVVYVDREGKYEGL